MPDVGAAAGFGDGQRADLLPGQGGPHVRGDQPFVAGCDHVRYGDTAGEQGRIHPARGAGLVHLLADDDGVGAVTAATTDRLGKAGAQQPGGPGEPVQAAGQLADPFPLVDVRQDLALGKGAHRFSQLLALRCGPDVHNRVSGISTWRLRSHSPSPLACGSKRAW